MLINFVLKVPINLLETTDIRLLGVERISISLSFNHFLKNLLYISLPLFTHTLFSFLLMLSKIFGKTSTIVIPFLSFKGTSHAYLLKISMAHNKNLVLLLNLLINCISAQSALQISSLNEE